MNVAGGWGGRLRRLARAARGRQAGRAAALLLAGVVLLVLLLRWPDDVPWAFYGPLVVLSGLFLTPRWFGLVCVEYAACLVFAGTTVRGWSTFQIGIIIALALTMALMRNRSRSRERLGVQGNDGENMLVDLRDRLLDLGRFPGLPAGWHAESAIRSAYADKFSGDFAVTSLSADGTRLEVALVDLSGKGSQAGTRSLLFSGAIGGLLGQVEPDRLLPAANTYLLRQGWPEGFASAVHVSIDLATGVFCIGNAGHPGPFQFFSGSGRWVVHESVGGPVLGIIEDADFPRVGGVLGRGDAIVLFTDGVIEVRGHDLDLGVDRLIGSAEGLLPRGLAGGARRLVEGAKAGDTDDRAVVMIWRD